MTFQIEVDLRGFRYAQEKPGQKLHLVADYGSGAVGAVALCGRKPACAWRMTINLPLGHACRNCCRAREGVEG